MVIPTSYKIISKHDIAYGILEQLKDTLTYIQILLGKKTRHREDKNNNNINKHGNNNKQARSKLNIYMA